MFKDFRTIYLYIECQCVIQCISEELLITTCSRHRYSRLRALNYQKNKLYSWKGSPIFYFVAWFGRLVEMGPRCGLSLCAVPSLIFRCLNFKWRLGWAEINILRDSREPIPWKGFWLKGIIQRTERTWLMGEPGFGFGIKSGQDFLIVDSEGQTSDVMDDRW